MATTDSDSPGTPTNLTATANGSSMIDLTWQAPADEGRSAIGGYQIEYRQGNGDWMDAEPDTGDTATSYSHTGLTADTQYGYRVSAINASGTGPATEEVTARTTTPANDPKPGALANVTATPAGDGEVMLSWDDPAYCGSGNSCSAGNHQHYLEYKLTSAADDAWGNGAAVAGSPHATTHTVPGLASGTEYDFRIAVQLNDETDRSPWVELSSYPGPDGDSDGVADAIDVDDDNDGLIEIATRAELDNMRHNLAGSSYRATDGAAGDTNGALTTEPTNCDDSDSGTTNTLCGYELANDIDLGGTTSATTDDPPDISCASNAWIPIGVCGSDGTCEEASNAGALAGRLRAFLRRVYNGRKKRLANL